MACIAGLQNGEAAAFRYIFTLFRPRLCFFANGLLPPSIDTTAEDVVQEAFVKLWERKTQFHHLESIRAFLYLSVKNACLNVLKHEKIVARYRGNSALVPEPPAITQRMMEAEVADQVQKALQLLPAGCRDVLQLSYFEGMKNEEAARHLHVSVNTIKSQKSRGMRLLKDLIKEPHWRVLLLAFIREIF